MVPDTYWDLVATYGVIFGAVVFGWFAAMRKVQKLEERMSGLEEVAKKSVNK
jgi:hypothetical protein